MEVVPIAILVGAALLGIGYVLRAPLVFAFFASLAFGSTAIVTLTALGGSTLLLYVPLVGLLIIASVFRRTFWRDLGRVFQLHWTPTIILILLLYAVASAFILPRLFAGETTVFVPMGGKIVETALRPVSGNINQAAYFTVGVLAFFAISSQLARDARFDLLRLGFFAFAGAHAALGLIDLMGKTAGAGDLLAPLRTAGFSMLTEVQVEGFWRITGAYPEASTFGGGSLIVLAFTFSYWRATNHMPALALSLLILALLLLCTSTTGYAGLVVLVLMLALSWLCRVVGGRISGGDLSTILGGVLVAVVVLGLLVLSESTLRPIQRLIEETLINKSSSASADERLYWNAKSWLAFLDTYGLGIGLGSSRASSSAIAILSQLGVIGAGLILVLLADLARPIPRAQGDPNAQELRAICNSLRTTAFATTIPAAIAGGGADLGIVFYIALAGVVVGRRRLRQMQSGPDRRQLEDSSGSGSSYTGSIPANRPRWARRPLPILAGTR